MAYRFSDTSKWNDEWFIDLSAHEKLMFLYLCDNCDIAGFYELSLRKMTFDLGLKNEEVKASLKGLQRGFILSVDNRVLFLKRFIKHQKNLPLNHNNKAHLGIFRRFDNYKARFSIDLIDLVNNNINESEFKGATMGLPSPTGIGKDKLSIRKEYKGVDFENFWSLYGRKVGNKKACEKKWCGLDIKTQESILLTLPPWKKQFDEIKYQPYPETYLNQERWNDEIISTTPQEKPQAIILQHRPVIDHSKLPA